MRVSKKLLLVLLITLVGIGIRMVHFNQVLWSQTGYDDSRDQLVSRHLVELGEISHRGPLAAGGFSWLQNSPGYYYLTASMWSLTRSVEGFTVGFILVSCLVIPLAYLVGSRLADRRTGFLAALLCALSPELVTASRIFSQPYLLPICVLLVLWILSYPPTLKRICLSIFLLLLPLHFHYGFLLFLPAGLYWVIKDWLKISPQMVELKLTTLKFFSPLVTMFSLGLIWILTTFTERPFDQFQFFILNFRAGTSVSLISSIQSAIHIFFELILQPVTDISGGLTIGLLMAGYFWLRTKTDTRKRQIFISFLGSYFLAFLFRGTLQMSYVIGFLPILLIGLALGLRWVIEKNKILGWGGVIVMIMIFLNASIGAVNSNLPTTSIYDQQAEISQDIYQNYQQLPDHHQAGTVPNLGIAVLITGNQQPFDGWGTPGIWYWLELKFQRRLVELTTFANNITPLEMNPRYIYFICDHRAHPEQVASECLERFQKVRDYLVGGYQEVRHTTDFTVWRFQTTLPEKPEFGYYFTYPDLMK